MKNIFETSWSLALSFFSKKILVGLILLAVFLSGAAATQGVLAQKLSLDYPERNANVDKPDSEVPNAYAENENYTLQTVVEILGEIRDFILIIGIVFIVIMIVWAGIQYVSAGGDAEQQASAKQKLIGALIGAAIILAAFALISTIRNLISEQSLT